MNYVMDFPNSHHFGFLHPKKSAHHKAFVWPSTFDDDDDGDPVFGTGRLGGQFRGHGLCSSFYNFFEDVVDYSFVWKHQNAPGNATNQGYFVR